MESVTDTPLSGPHATGNTPSTALSEPNAHGVDILAAPENAGNLPVLPDASEDDEITMFSEDLHGSSSTSIRRPDVTV